MEVDDLTDGVRLNRRQCLLGPHSSGRGVTDSLFLSNVHWVLFCLVNNPINEFGVHKYYSLTFDAALI